MIETIEKAKVVAGRPFRLVRQTGRYHFKRQWLGYILGFPYAEGSLVDDGKDPWAPGNFLLEKRDGTEPGNYRDFDILELAVPEIPGIQPGGTVYGRAINHDLKPWDAGNFAVIHTETVVEEINGREKKRIVQTLEPRDLNTFQYWKLAKIGADGKVAEVIYGRQRSFAFGPWESGNFEAFLPAKDGNTGGWTPLDFNKDFPEQTWQKTRVAPKLSRKNVMAKTKNFTIQFKDDFTYTNWKDETVVARGYYLATGPTLWKLLEEKIKGKVEDGNDPCHYWLTITYTEKPRGDGTTDAPPEVTYVIDAVKMTDAEVKALPPVEQPAQVPVRDAHEEPPVRTAEEELFGTDDINLDEVPF